MSMVKANNKDFVQEHLDTQRREATMSTLAHRLVQFVSARLLQIAILAAASMLTGIGCGGGSGTTTATSVPQPTLPTPTPTPPAPVVPPVPAGWTNLDTHWFSFSYPSGWQLTDQTSANPPYANAAEPGFAHQFLVEFEPGVVNQPGILDQCAGARQALVDFYNANVLPLEKNVGQYPNTTTTYEPNYGFLSGVEIQIRVVSTPATSGPNFDLWLNAIPHTDGLYLVGYVSPDSDALDAWTAARKKFTDTIFFKSAALSPAAACNYKG